MEEGIFYLDVAQVHASDKHKNTKMHLHFGINKTAHLIESADLFGNIYHASEMVNRPVTHNRTWFFLTRRICFYRHM